MINLAEEAELRLRREPPSSLPRARLYLPIQEMGMRAVSPAKAAEVARGGSIRAKAREGRPAGKVL